MAQDALSGLSEAEAQRRLAQYGPNELPPPPRRNLVVIVGETMREPMFLLLVGAAALYLVLGDLAEGLFLLAGAGVAIGLVVAQEARSERALAALRALARPSARVLRDGVARRIPARELAPGDIMLVGEGERLPADGVLVRGDVLSIDESVLTGESAPVTRLPGVATGPAGAPPMQDASLLLGGTLVVRGQGVARVTQTGVRSALGKIGASLAVSRSEPTPLQRTTGRLTAVLGAGALAFCAVIAVGYGLLRGQWIPGVLSGVTVAMSLIPEEFPMVLSVFLALGAWRLANHKVLVRRSAAIETLGAASVLCVDKTGTLTQNRMRVARLWTPGEDLALDDAPPPAGPALELLRMAHLASAVRPVDPMDQAVGALAREVGLATCAADAEPRRTWPLQPDRLAIVQLWREQDDVEVAAAKGAPEAIFRLCRLSEAEVLALHPVVERYAALGLRVLGVASVRGHAGFLTDPGRTRFEFAGLVGFVDPLRPDVPAALAEARGAGVKVIMLTGDHPATALAIAHAAGLDGAAGVLTGAELSGLSIDDLRARLKTVRVFARVTPDQKLKLVEALRANGEVVAMTGDGVNDAPALEAAHIGLSMGQRGSDVAREASDLILLDDSFASIVGGVRLGRRIFVNLRRALTYLMAIHVPVAGAALAPLLLGWPPILYPVHVVLLELVIDPTCTLVFEGEPSSASAMRRPPRSPREPLFGARQMAIGVLEGASVLVAVLVAYALARAADNGDAPARGAAFLALVTGNLALALSNAAASAKLFAPYRRVYWIIVALMISALIGIFSLRPVAEVFRLTAPDLGVLLESILLALVAGTWTAAFPALRAR